MIILVHAVIPHHHHQDKPICVNELEQQDCEKHNKCCDFGGQDDKHDFDKGNCIIDDYFTPKESLKLTLNHAFTYNHVVFVLPDITSVSDLILKEKGNIFRRTELALIYKNPLAKYEALEIIAKEVNNGNISQEVYTALVRSV